MYEAVVEYFFFSSLLMSYVAGNADKEIFFFAWEWQSTVWMEMQREDVIRLESVF